MQNWRTGPGKAFVALACMVVSALECMVPQTVHAQSVIDYGGQTPCSLWLSNPTATRQGVAWLCGAWSGLNMAGGLKHDVFDVGHTLTAQQVAGAVERICRQDMTKIMNAAVLDAYVAARIEKR